MSLGHSDLEEVLIVQVVLDRLLVLLKSELVLLVELSDFSEFVADGL